MDENLDGKHRGLSDGGDFDQRELTSKDDSAAAELLGELNAGFACDGHLSGGVDLKVWRDGFDQPAEAQVLNDDGINAGLSDLADEDFELGKLPGEDEGVECDVASNASAVEEVHHFVKTAAIEVCGAGAGVVSSETEIDGIGPIFDGRDEAGLITGGGQKLWPGLRSERAHVVAVQNLTDRHDRPSRTLWGILHRY